MIWSNKLKTLTGEQKVPLGKPVISAVSIQAMGIKSGRKLLDWVRQMTVGDWQYIRLKQSVTEKKGKYENDYSLVDELVSFKSRLCIPDASGLRLEILEAEHDSIVTGHFG